MRGGTGIDWLNTTSFNGDYVVNLAAGATNYAGEDFIDFENLVSGSGNDSLTGTTGANAIYAGAGNDTVDGGTGDDYLYGDLGADSLLGGGGTDSVYGAAGDDTIRSSGAGYYDGGTENDYIYAGLGSAETLVGGSGTDWLNTRTFNGNYLVNLATGATNFAGESFTGFENGITGNGNDTVLGTAAANSFYTGGGNDVVNGGAGNDFLSGELGNDVLSGGDGSDVVQGGAGTDRLAGNTGNDTLIGLSGSDTLTGGVGEDIFVFNNVTDSAPGTGFDLITDFQGAGLQPGPVTEDRIDLTNVYGGVLTFTGTVAGGMGTAWVVNSGAETWLRVNIDADAAIEMTVRINDGASNANSYVASDFLL